VLGCKFVIYGNSPHSVTSPTCNHVPALAPLLTRLQLVGRTRAICPLWRAGRMGRAAGGLQGFVMKRHVSTGGRTDDEPPADGPAEGQLLPKLGKLKDVSRQRRGDILGARGSVKVQGQKYVPKDEELPTVYPEFSYVSSVLPGFSTHCNGSICCQTRHACVACKCIGVCGLCV